MQLNRRMIKPDFWTDAELNKKLLPAGRMFYIGLWQLAEASGVIEADPFTYKMILFPVDDITVETIKKWVEILTETKKLIPFTANNKDYYFIKNFHKHQSLRNPSKPELPLPDFVRYIENNKKYQAGGYIINYDLIEDGNCSGIKFFGNINESIKKQYRNDTETVPNDYRSGWETNKNKNMNKKENKNLELENELESELEKEKEKELNIYTQKIEEVYDYWIELLSDVNKARLTKNQKETILTKIKKWDKEKIIQAIKNYNEIYRSDFYYSHNFTMNNFIKSGNGIPRFLPGLDDKYDGDIWKDYQDNKNNSSQERKINREAL